MWGPPVGALYNNSIGFAMGGAAQEQVVQKVGLVHMELECGEAWDMLQK